MTRVGWCPGRRTVAEMLATYPGTSTARIFVGPGNPVPDWTGPVLGPLVAAGVRVVHLSVKTPDWPAVRRLVGGKPAGLLLILTFGHEPEQGVAEGDLPIDQWKARWAELVALLADHPARGELLLVPVYTRFWWEKNGGDRRWLLDLPVDAIGWDIYSSDPSRYRTPDDLLTIPRAVAGQTGLPYLVPELGAVRVAGDTDGAGRQAWMRAMVDAIKADGAITCCWFHKDAWDLLAADPARQTWQELIQEATVWHLAPSLKNLRDEINTRWPGRDHTSDGSVGDIRHQATHSDHNPNSRGSVNAIDVDEDGIDPYEVTAAFQRHPSAHYWIYERQIADKDDGWRRRPYDGVNPHDKHVHFSIRQTVAAEQNTQPWGLLEEDIVATLDELRAVVRQELAPVRSAVDYIDGRVEGMAYGRTQVRAGLKGAGQPVAVVQMVKALADALGKVDEQVAAQLADDFARIEQAVAEGPQLDPKAIADAIPAELARLVADELAARLAS